MILALAIALCLHVATAGPAPRARSTSAAARLETHVASTAQADFESSLAELQALLEHRRWKDAERALRALLLKHAGADYVRPHLQALREDLERAAFWQVVDEPRPETLISGRLLRYSPSSGNVRVLYALESAADFVVQGAARVHPMHFSDSWELEVEGTPDEVANLAYFVMLSPSQGYLLRFGQREKGQFLYSLHFAQRLDGSEQVVLAEAEPELRKSRSKTVKGEIQVSRRSIRMKYDGRKVLEIDKTEEDCGSLALIASTPDGALSPFGTLIVDGKIDRGWLGGLLDEAVADQRSAFEAQWVDPPEFAAWGTAPQSESHDLSSSELFGRLKFRFRLEQQEQLTLFDEVCASFGKGPERAAATLAQIGAWSDDTLPPSARAYLELNCQLELERPMLALRALDALQVDPEQALDLEILRAELLSQSGRLAQAQAAFERIARQHPEVSLAHLRSAEALLLLGRPESAHEAILRGLESSPASPRLHELEVKVVKASKGPSWNKSYQQCGKHFAVWTDVDRRLVRKASQVLDEAWEHCLEFFGPLPEGAFSSQPGTLVPGFSVHSSAYLFSGEASYLDYVHGVADPGLENTLGVYSQQLKQIAAWNQSNSEELWRTLRHEVVHRYLDLAIGSRIPRWLNEGLAECFASCWGADDEFGRGRVSRAALYTLRARKALEPLRTFVLASETDFLQDAELGYAQAFALVCFLRFGSEEPQKLLDDLIEGLRAGQDPALVLSEALGACDPEHLQQEFLQWLDARLREL